VNILVTGAYGQLGRDLCKELRLRGHRVIPCGRRVENENGVLLDVSDRERVMEVFEKYRPDGVVHAAAYTAVDKAEEEPEEVFRCNALGTRNIAEACKAVDAKLIYLSTDYVFRDLGDAPHRPEEEPEEAWNVYGASKLAGERAVRALLDRYFILRISWVFGLFGKNFVKTMLAAGKKHDSVRVVTDQIGRPSYTPDLSRLLGDMIETERYGIYHACNEGENVSWYEFCREIYAQAGLKTKVIPVTTEEYGLNRAKRPMNSRLSTEKLKIEGFCPLPDWRDALTRFLCDYRI